MKKNLLICIALLAVLLASCQQHNTIEDAEIKGVRYIFNGINKQAEVMSVLECSSSFSVPSVVRYKGRRYKITSIGNNAFKSNNKLIVINIPNGITSIGNDAFSDCCNLTTVTLPKSLTNLGERAFYNCSALVAVHISDIASWCEIKFNGYSSNPLYYAKKLFLNGELVTKLCIPEGVMGISDWAFERCNSFTSVIIPKGMVSIGDFAFESCSSLTSIVIPEGVTNIGHYAFYGCSGLVSTTIPRGVVCIGEKAFSGCTGELVVNSDISSAALLFDSAFYNSRFAKIVIGGNVTSIGERAFYKCSSLKSVKVLASTPPTADKTSFDNSGNLYHYYYNIELCVPKKAVSVYQNTLPWSNFKTISGF